MSILSFILATFNWLNSIVQFILSWIMYVFILAAIIVAIYWIYRMYKYFRREIWINK